MFLRESVGAVSFEGKFIVWTSQVNKWSSLLSCGLLLTLPAAIGCSDQSGDATVDGTRSGALKSASPATSAELAVDQESGSPLTPRSSVAASSVAGSGTTDDGAVHDTVALGRESGAGAAGDGTARVVRPPVAPSEEPQDDPLVKGVEFPSVNIQNLLAGFREAWSKKPNSSRTVTDLAGLYLRLGEYHEEQGHRALARSAFLQGGDVLDQANAQSVRLPSDLQGVLYFHVARMAAQQGRTDDALQALDKAYERGMFRLQPLAQDPLLKSVRDLPVYADRLEQWKALLRETLRTKVTQELAGNVSFPMDFDLVDVTGTSLKLSDFRGRVCAVVIGGTWCAPCREEIPTLVELQKQFAAKGFQIIGLSHEHGASAEQNQQRVQELCRSSGVNYPCAVIDSKFLSMIPEFDSYPTVLFFDRAGVMRLRLHGVHEREHLAMVIERLLERDGNTESPEKSENSRPSAD